MQKVFQSGLIEVGSQQAAALNLRYDSFFSPNNVCYFIWDAVKRLRSSTLVTSCKLIIVTVKILNLWWKWMRKIEFDMYICRSSA